MYGIIDLMPNFNSAGEDTTEETYTTAQVRHT
jgi:hypothetical protein